MASFRPALTEAPHRNQPHWSRPVNSGPRPCLVSVGFPLSGSRDRTSTSESQHPYLAYPLDLAAYVAAVCSLLDDPARAEAMGRAAKKSVRHHFLGTRTLIQAIELYERQPHAGAAMKVLHAAGAFNVARPPPESDQ